jgi:hypothetical protein
MRIKIICSGSVNCTLYWNAHAPQLHILFTRSLVQPGNVWKKLKILGMTACTLTVLETFVLTLSIYTVWFLCACSILALQKQCLTFQCDKIPSSKDHVCKIFFDIQTTGMKWTNTIFPFFTYLPDSKTDTKNVDDIISDNLKRDQIIMLGYL